MITELQQAIDLCEVAENVKSNRKAFFAFTEDAYIKTLKAARKLRKRLAQAPTDPDTKCEKCNKTVHLTLPALIPHVKDKHEEKIYFRNLIYPVIAKAQIPYYTEPVMIIWKTGYKLNTRDADNLDWKIVLDVLNEKLFADDNQEACSQLFLSAGKTDTTELFIMPLKDFKDWIKNYAV